MIRHLAPNILFAALLLASDAAAQTGNDYGDAKNWLCRPGRQDAPRRGRPPGAGRPDA